MQLKKIALADSRSFTPFFLDYIQQLPALKRFYHRFPDIRNFNDQILEKSSFSVDNRKVLVNTLQEQYKALTITDAVTQNIASLSTKNTFTITTGHQLNIATGPLYFIFKIVTVINICKTLKRLYPDYNFVPVYWMASEDHDYDEIKSFRLYGKKYSWTTEQKGAVGRFGTTGLGALMKELPGDVSVFLNAYSKQKTLADAVRQYVNDLFGKEGLVVVDADHKNLKSLFKYVIREDVLHNNVKKLVDQTDEELKGLGYKTQIYCREINFFLLDDNLRDRIEREGEDFTLVENEKKFKQSEIENLIESSPEKFSPNVILRPLYQEVILPNLAYIGGPAEIIYWLQLKQVFDHFKTPFPILMPRNFGMVMDHTLVRKFEKTGLDLKDLFEEKNYIFNHWTLKNTNHDLTVGKERETLRDLFEKLKSRAGSIDQTLAPFVGAEGKRALNSIEKIEQKLLRAEKRLHQDTLRQIEAVKDALFPNGSLQERSDNFLNFYQQDPQFIQMLLETFDPFDFMFNIFLLE